MLTVKVFDPETKKIKYYQIEGELKKEEIEKIFEAYKPVASNEELEYHIDSLDLSAEAKQLLAQLKETVIKIGNKVLEIGKKILEVIIAFVKKYPNTAIGLVVGLVLAAIVSSIPLLGWILGSIVNLLLPALGLVVGLIHDWKEQANKNNIPVQSVAEYFSLLKSIPVQA